MPEITDQPNKLLEFQKRVSAISKDSVNPFFKSKYFDVNTVIDTIKPILNEVGLTVTQPFRVEEGKNVLKTYVSDGDKDVVMSTILLPEITDVQKLGAAITYLRRYSLVSLLLLQGEEDDDGNKTRPTPSKAPQKAEFKRTEPENPLTPHGSLSPNSPAYIVPAYEHFSDKIKNVTNEDGLHLVVEELKTATKTMKPQQVALLRSEVGNKRKELELMTIE